MMVSADPIMNGRVTRISDVEEAPLKISRESICFERGDEGLFRA